MSVAEAAIPGPGLFVANQKETAMSHSLESAQSAILAAGIVGVKCCFLAFLYPALHDMGQFLVYPGRSTVAVLAIYTIANAMRELRGGRRRQRHALIPARSSD